MSCGRIRPVIIQTADGATATLDEAHWETHIVARHPELGAHREKVVDTLAHPDGIFRSRRDPETRIYLKAFTGVAISNTFFDNLALLVYVRSEGGFVVTAHFAAAMWRSLGERLWPL